MNNITMKSSTARLIKPMSNSLLYHILQEISNLSISTTITIFAFCTCFTMTFSANEVIGLTSQKNNSLKSEIKRVLIEGGTSADELTRTSYYVSQIDLNNDGYDEYIVAINHTPNLCSSRYCPIYIFQKIKGTYRLIKLTGSSQKGDARVAVLPTKKNGWHDISYYHFNYQPRGMVWSTNRFDRTSYEPSSIKSTSNHSGKIVISSKVSKLITF
jgi:lipopolysaccharide export LptBFGC system permease protein LptF